MGYRLVRALSRVLVGLFYHRTPTACLERVPASAPLIVCANHHGSLVDALVLLALLPRRLRPLAKAPLFQHRLFGPFLRLLGALPVYRAQDRHLVAGSNAALLQDAAAALTRHEALLMFPEGGSQPAPRLAALRPGAARIALSAEADAQFRLGVQLLPVTLHFEDAATFRRGTITVEVGQPLELADLRDLHARSPDDAISELVRRLDDALRLHSMELDGNEDLDLLRTAARAWSLERGKPLASDQELELVRRVARAYNAGSADDVGRAQQQVRIATANYSRTLRHFRLRGHEIDRRQRWLSAVGFLCQRGVLLIVLAPFGVLGQLVHAPAAHISSLLAARLSETEDSWASYSIVVGLVVFPVFWLIMAAVTAGALGVLAGIAALLGLPLLGLVSIRFRDRCRDLEEHIRGFILVAAGSALRRQLETSRRAVHDSVEALLRPRGEALAPTPLERVGTREK